jgi:hypothetical protein
MSFRLAELEMWKIVQECELGEGLYQEGEEKEIKRAGGG